MENALHARDRVGLQDFVLLEDFNSEEAFLDNLRKRFHENLIYTYIGPVLISLNPYKELNLYGQEYIKQYHRVHFHELPPHIYAIGDSAYTRMLDEAKDQCVLISGESGAGKTEASKLILRYLASASQSSRTMEWVKDRLIHSNPVLEAFGNAKTKRNDNSSRFGKYMDVEFDYLGVPLGGHILNYLLEKSRVIKQEFGERNFHIFYQLLSGASDQDLARWHLTRDTAFYNYLAPSSGYTHEDAKQFEKVLQSLAIIDFTEEEQECLLSLVACILHLGNVKFMDDLDQPLFLDPCSPIDAIVELVGCPRQVLLNALTHRTIEAKGEIMTTPLNAEQASYVRDALAKAIYERLFIWLVNKVNTSLESKKKGNSKVIGLLDIYGFEIFSKNSFEQFCINYCNEKLHQLFIELTLKSEQEEYLKEGIEWESINYFNNKIICDLIEERHVGIISILDEECLRPGDATDLTFLEKMEENIGKHPHFTTHRLATSPHIKKKIGRQEFQIIHYAGEVIYQVKGFLDKNNDLLYRDLKMAMAKSENLITNSTFANGEIKNKKRPETAATQFKSSLSQLMSILLSKEPWYIRCIKPNNFKAPDVFGQDVVANQVRYLGLMENIRVRRAGFAYRRCYKEFLQRYKSLCPSTWPSYPGPAKLGVHQLLVHLEYSPTTHFSMGKTKIFIKYPRTLFEIEDLFQQRKNELATKIQAHFRGYCQRKRFLAMKKSAMLITCHWKRHLAYRLLCTRRWAAQTIRRFIRGFITRNGPPNEDNNRFSWHVKAEFLHRLALHLPKSLLDKSWPPSPLSCQEASELIRALHRRWLARKYCRSLSGDKKIQFELKVLAEDLFKDKKSSYPASIPSLFESSRLNSEQEALKSSIFEKTVKTQGEKTLYCLQVTKFDRHGYKTRPRIIVLTTSALYVLEAQNFKLKHRLPLKTLKGFVASSLSDGILVIRIPEEMKKDKGDLIVDCGPYLIELVVKVVSAVGSKSLLTIEPTYKIIHHLSSGKQGFIIFKQGSEHLVLKDRDGQLSVVAASP